MAKKTLRNIAICIKSLTKVHSVDSTFLEKDLTFIGLYGLRDPPRKEVMSAIMECREAGIKTVMITGDHVKTARAIANQIDLLPENGLILEGFELNDMSTADLRSEERRVGKR